MSPFEKVGEPKSRSSYVAEQIINSIEEGEYQPGDKLPSEREIADQMGVSRNSVREALSALQIVNIVKRKAGSGTFINSNPIEVNINEALSLARRGQDLLEVWEARRAVEINLAELALKRANQADLKRLRKILSELEIAAKEDNREIYLKKNESFHLAIAEMARNKYLKNALKALMGVTKEHVLQNMVEDYGRYMNQSIGTHKEILEAINDGSFENISSALVEHFSELEGYLKTRLFENSKS